MAPSRRRAGRAQIIGFCLLLIASAMLHASVPTASADVSFCFGLITRTPMVHVQMSGLSSYAQLIQRLQSQGYTDIKVTVSCPNVMNPRPELTHPDSTFSSPDDRTAQYTAIHFGWIGTAVKDGKIFEVYADRAPYG